MALSDQSPTKEGGTGAHSACQLDPQSTLLTTGYHFVSLHPRHPPPLALRADQTCHQN